MRSNLEGARIHDSILTKGVRQGTTSITLDATTSTFTFAADSPAYAMIDPGGSGRTITLPAVKRGAEYYVVNTADANERLTVVNASATTIGYVDRNQIGKFVSDGTSWFADTPTGLNTTSPLGFYGTAGATQPTSASQAAVATTVSISTGATTTTLWGFSTSTQANALVTLVNQLRSDLVTLGLIKGS